MAFFDWLPKVVKIQHFFNKILHFKYGFFNRLTDRLTDWFDRSKKITDHLPAYSGLMDRTLDCGICGRGLESQWLQLFFSQLMFRIKDWKNCKNLDFYQVKTLIQDCPESPKIR